MAAVPEEYLIIMLIRAFANRIFIKWKKKIPLKMRPRLSVILFPGDLQASKGRRKMVI